MLYVLGQMLPGLFSVGSRLPAYKLALGMSRTSQSMRPAAVSQGHNQTGDDTTENGKIKRVAVAQMTSSDDQQANFTVCETLVKDAAAKDCLMTFFPECFSFLGGSQRASIKAAQPLSGPLVAQYCDLARKYDMWLSLGGFQETGPDADHIYNCHVVINALGDVVASYRKIHLFNVSVPNGPILEESKFTAAGTQMITCDSPVGKLGLSVCYDLRFPHMYQELAFRGGAQILLVPSAFTKPTGEAHWHTLLKARAIENQAYVIAAAQAGKHNEKRESYGHSLIIHPWGNTIASLTDPQATGIAVADIDLGELERVRTNMPIQDHRQTGLAAVQSNIHHVSLQ